MQALTYEIPRNFELDNVTIQGGVEILTSAKLRKLLLIALGVHAVLCGRHYT